MNHKKYFLLFTLFLGVCLGGMGQTEIAYSFGKTGNAGCGLITVVSKTNIQHRIMFNDSNITKPRKVRLSKDGKWLVLVSDVEGKPNFFFYNRIQNKLNRLTLPHVPDEVRLYDDRAVLTGSNDLMLQVDLMKKEMTHIRNAEHHMSPTANGPEDIQVVDHNTYAIVSFQKDSRTGKHKGGRLAAFSLPDWKLVSDVFFPRDFTDLHYKGNLKQQGPGPEVILWSSLHNCVGATLDLYGGVYLMDKDAFLQRKRVNGVFINTHLDGKRGHAFPDRATLFQVSGIEYAAVANAGQEGGCVLINLDSRSIVQQWKTPHGLEAPVWLPHEKKLVSVASGKLKFRGSFDVQKTEAPTSGVWFMPFDPQDNPATEQPIHLKTPEQPIRIARVTLQDSDALVLFYKNKVTVTDVALNETWFSQDLPGKIRRIDHHIINK